MESFLAEKFIEKARDMTEYNINIMNEKGIIIASKDGNRIGHFHEIAYWIVHGDEEIIEVPEEENELMGVKNGVMLPIVQKGKRIGAIGVTGEPDQVRQIGKVMRFAIETMYEFELQRAQNTKRQGIKERLINNFLYNEAPDLEKIREDAQTLGWDECYVRIPIYMVLDNMADIPTVIRKLKSNMFYDRQDIISPVREEQIIIFKSFKQISSDISVYKEIVTEYLSSCVEYLEVMGVEYSIYIGTFQQDFEHYNTSFRHCLWLKKHVQGKICYFYEYVDEYMKELVTLVEYRDIYQVYDHLMDEKTQKDFIEIIDSLQKNNYNFNASSKQLYVHKNTLVFRFNKIKKLLGVNPMQQVEDREFLSYLYYYMKNRK